MSDKQPHDTVTPEARKLLKGLIHEVVTTARLPLHISVNAKNAPWIIDELRSSGLVVDWRDGTLLPTLRALRLIADHPSRRLLAATKGVFNALREFYIEDAARARSTTELVSRGNVQNTLAVKALTVLVASTSITQGLSLEGNTGRVTGAQPSDRILIDDPFAPEPIEPLPSLEGPVSIFFRDFHGLAKVTWSPEGVCLVAGPNGSGKSTLLDALAFLRDAFVRGVPHAVTQQRGATGIRRLDASGPPEVLLGMSVGDVSWELRLTVEGSSVGAAPGEVVKRAEQVLLRRAAHSDVWYLGRDRRSADTEGRTCLRVSWEVQQSPVLAPLVNALRSFQVYGLYSLEGLRNGGTGSEGEERLDPSGKNLFIVLRNWKAAPRRFGDKFAWVLRQAKLAFPGLIDDIEFDPPVGQIVPTRFYKPGVQTALPMHRAPDGLLVGLLHLTAVASAQEGAVIAIEEMENQLHPHAIRKLLAAMREIAEERRLTILLTTHSPVLMNEFRDQPEQFYVLEPGRDVLPVSLDQLHDPEWLAHFQLGDLYDRLEFGAPRPQGV
ncbi:AAA family ATPase [Chondromyces crocatus]|uniref:ATPase AAA-type core domain-containing protein n=1 Tax=Chondromyces crocatus TaxID=52 RepID=A0A0K1ELA6_CHOCO|nr:AAA family ATPase [Chondromyces crocatus]AKT41398.1 uncharacterized protein CMC5_055980 [Chondromyces crocatus]